MGDFAQGAETVRTGFSQALPAQRYTSYCRRIETLPATPVGYELRVVLFLYSTAQQHVTEVKGTAEGGFIGHTVR